MQPYYFTDDDKRNPVYCHGCRAHIPRDVSLAGQGFCPTCQAALQAGQSIHSPVPTGFQPPAQANQPGLPRQAYCPQCHSPYIVYAQVRTWWGRPQLIVAGLVLSGLGLLCMFHLLLLGIGLLIIGIAMPWVINPPGTMRRCQNCGFRWKI